MAATAAAKNMTEELAVQGAGLMLETSTRCSRKITSDTQLKLATMVWLQVTEEIKTRVKNAIDAKINSLGLEKFCNEVVALLQGPEIRPDEEEEPEIKVSVLKATRTQWTIQALVAVDNPTNRQFKYMTLSCIVQYKGEPVYESSEIVKSVSPNGRTIQQVHIFTDVRADRVDCRYTGS